jgi:hypothetical protein
MITKCQQTRYVAIGFKPHRATVATVATVWSTVNNRALATETDAAGSAIAGTYIQLAFVDKGTHDQ